LLEDSSIFARPRAGCQMRGVTGGKALRKAGEFTWKWDIRYLTWVFYSYPQAGGMSNPGA
jgi:hypothetical protein